jgi:hypothetical protein
MTTSGGGPTPSPTALATCCFTSPETCANGWSAASVAQRTGGNGNRSSPRGWDSAEELLTNLEQTLKEVEATLAQLEPQRLLERRTIQGHDVTLLEALYHVVEHFAMHAGQIIYIAKLRFRQRFTILRSAGRTAPPPLVMGRSAPLLQRSRLAFPLRRFRLRGRRYRRGCGLRRADSGRGRRVGF